MYWVMVEEAQGACGVRGKSSDIEVSTRFEMGEGFRVQGRGMGV